MTEHPWERWPTGTADTYHPAIYVGEAAARRAEESIKRRYPFYETTIQPLYEGSYRWAVLYRKSKP